MAVVREHLVVGGEIVEQGGGVGGDDDGAPPAMEGVRVHTAEDIDTAGTRPMTEEEARQFGIIVARPKKAKAPPATKSEKSSKTSTKAAMADDVSDRRRCLELAVASGETDPERVLEVARRYVDFLEGSSED